MCWASSGRGQGSWRAMYRGCAFHTAGDDEPGPANLAKPGNWLMWVCSRRALG
jgi:hypothetical protein